MNDEQLKEWQEEQQKRQTLANSLIPGMIGKTLEEAREIAHANDLPSRTRSIDGKGCIGTCDLKPDRFNFKIVNNIITDVTLG